MDNRIKDAIAFAKPYQADAFLAVGGGSVIDTAKLMNLYTTFPGPSSSSPQCARHHTNCTIQTLNSLILSMHPWAKANQLLEASNLSLPFQQPQALALK